jgi:hypothetical protein
MLRHGELPAGNPRVSYQSVMRLRKRTRASQTEHGEGCHTAFFARTKEKYDVTRIHVDKCLTHVIRGFFRVVDQDSEHRLALTDYQISQRGGLRRRVQMDEYLLTVHGGHHFPRVNATTPFAFDLHILLDFYLLIFLEGNVKCSPIPKRCDRDLPSPDPTCVAPEKRQDLTAFMSLIDGNRRHRVSYFGMRLSIRVNSAIFFKWERSDAQT